MRTPSHTFRLLGAVLAAGLISGQAMAADATADTFAAVLKPITLVKTSDLNFGLLLASTGTVNINPANGNRTGDTGTISSATGSTPTRAVFTVGGLANQTYSISATAATVVLANTVTPSNVLTVTLSGVHALSNNATGTAAAASAGKLDANGNDTLGVGGSLLLASSTPIGNYTNRAGIALTVNYN